MRFFRDFVQRGEGGPGWSLGTWGTESLMRGGSGEGMVSEGGKNQESAVVDDERGDWVIRAVPLRDKVMQEQKGDLMFGRSLLTLAGVSVEVPAWNWLNSNGLFLKTCKCIFLIQTITTYL